MENTNHTFKKVPIETLKEGEELRLVEDGYLYVVKEMFFDSEPESKINQVGSSHYAFVPHGTAVYIAVKETEAPKTKVYICGKITGMEEAAAVNFQQIEDLLLQAGFEPVNPMKLPHQHDKSWESYMRDCIKALYDCDGIYIMENAFDSRGAQLEVTIAEKLLLQPHIRTHQWSPIYYIDFKKIPIQLCAAFK